MTVPGSTRRRYDRLDLNEPLAPETPPPSQSSSSSSLSLNSTSVNHQDPNNNNNNSNSTPPMNTNHSNNSNPLSGSGSSSSALMENDLLLTTSTSTTAPSSLNDNSGVGGISSSNHSTSSSLADTNTPLLHQQQQQHQQQQRQNSPSSSKDSKKKEEENVSVSKTKPKEEDKSSYSFAVVILDGLHRKFRVPASPDWTIAEFKTAGSSIHHVAPSAQRLIYMGRMLNDDSTLKQCGIQQTETIVHLFPKPTMVITDNSNNDNTNNDSLTEDSHDSQNDHHQTSSSHSQSQSHNNHNGGGAHVPQIVVDAEEARRSSTMVIFTSSEMFEAQHRVKLFSFFLLFICTMELLSLLSIMLGASADPYNNNVTGDDIFSPGGGVDPNDYPSSNNMPLREWRNSDYVDLVISSCGFYVSTLGIRATTENTLLSAKRYFYGLVVVGVAWVSYYYYLDVLTAEAMMNSHAHDDNNNDNNPDDNNNDNNGGTTGDNPSDNVIASQTDLYIQALFGVSLPICIWGICFLRAYQFQQLVQQAEIEALERHGRFTRELERGNSEHEHHAPHNSNPNSNNSNNNTTITVAFGGDQRNNNRRQDSSDDLASVDNRALI